MLIEGKKLGFVISDLEPQAAALRAWDLRSRVPLRLFQGDGQVDANDSFADFSTLVL